MRWSLAVVMVLVVSALGSSRASALSSAPHGIAWLDSIQARLDGAQAAAAESLAVRAIRECEADSGANSLSVGRLSRLLGVARLRQRGATYERVWPAFERADTLLAHHLGRKSLEFGGLLASEAAVLGSFKRFEQGVWRAKEAVALFESQSAPLDSLAIRALIALGGIHGHAGQPAEARPAFERAALAALRLSPPDSLRAALYRCDAALAATQDGDLLGAEALLDAAGPVIERRLGPADVDRVRYGTIRLTLLRRTSDLVGQLAILDPAVTQLEKRRQPDATLARRLRERAVVRSQLGDAAMALDDLRRATELFGGTLGPSDPTTLSAQFEYAQLLDEAGERVVAESTYVRAMRAAQQIERSPGELMALGLATHAARAYARRDFVAAREGFERAAQLHEQSQGPLALDLAATLLELSRVTAEMGRVDTTYLLAERARSILIRKRSPEHPDMGDLDGQEAWVEARAGDPVRAWERALSATANHLRYLQLVQPGLPEPLALELARSKQYRLAIALSVAGQRAATARGADQSKVRATWEALMISRGAVLEHLAQRRHALRAGETAARSADSLYRLASARYAKLLVGGGDEDSASGARLIRARAELEAAERAWGTALGGKRGNLDVGGDRLARMRAKLQPLQAMVGLALHEEVAGRPAGYVAFLLKADDATVRVVSLGSAHTLDSLIARWRGSFELNARRAARDSAAGEREALALGGALRKRLWDPIARELPGTKQVFFVPDGAAQLVNPGALPDDRGGYLIESGPTFILLTRELDLVSARSDARAPHELLAIGAPDFDQALTAIPATSVSFRGLTEGCGTFRDLRFSALPATQDELRAIAAGHQDATVCVGALADEATFKREAPRHRLVHVATHGFFLGEGCATSSAGRGIGGLASTPASALTASRMQASPMRLSGLALAGANRRADVDAEHEDGILTAEEIAALDLSGVERVVLSACHTGVGDVLTGEGVTGLRRAFRVAGVGTQVMSLWDVEDRATAEWMLRLHRAWGAGIGTAEAVRQASREQLAARRAAGMSTHPIHWGAFVAIGDPR